MVRNSEQVERDRQQRERALERLEAEIQSLNRGVKRRGKEHNRAVCSLKSHPTLGRYLKELKSGDLRIDRAKVRAETKLDGKYLLSTTDPSLSAEDAALGYKQLAEVERAFRTLKQTLDLRPLYHRLPGRIQAHVLLCWLALLLVRVLEQQTGETWERMREELDQLVPVDLRGPAGKFQVTSELTEAQRRLLKQLQMDPPKRVRSAQLAPPPARRHYIETAPSRNPRLIVHYV